MKIVCSRESLLNSFVIASSVIKPNNAKAILTNIKIESSADGTVLQAGDSEIRLRVNLTDVEVEEPGAALLPTARVRSVLSESKAETIRIETNGSNLILISGGSKFNFPTEDPEEFPPVDAFNKTDYLVFNGAELVKAMAQTTFASDPTASQAVFGGVLFSIENDKANLVATDTRRMSHGTVPVTIVGNLDNSKAISAIVPKATMQLAERVFANTEGEIKVLFNNNRVIFSSSAVTFYAQLLEGTFPKWQSVFNKEIAYEVEITPSEFTSVVKQASIVATPEYRGIVFKFQSNVLELSGHSPEYGDSNVKMDVNFPEEKAFEMKIDPSFIIDFMRVLDSSAPCKMQLISGNNPVLFRPTESLEYAVMPLSMGR